MYELYITQCALNGCVHEKLSSPSKASAFDKGDPSALDGTLVTEIKHNAGIAVFLLANMPSGLE